MRAVGVFLAVVSLAMVVACGGGGVDPATPKAEAIPTVVRAVDGKAIAGNVEVSFKRVLIGGEHTIEFTLRNLDENLIWHFEGYESRRLIDEHGNDYSPRGRPGRDEKVQPGASLDGWVEFDEPSKTAKHFKLSIGLKTIQGEKVIEFVYPLSFAQTVP